MKRDIDNVLLTWKIDPQRRPLLVRGARQVGKSYSITQFGQKEFSNLTIINFEQRPEVKTCFDTLNPKGWKIELSPYLPFSSKSPRNNAFISRAPKTSFFGKQRFFSAAEKVPGTTGLSRE
jgi:hypothetical protein